MTSSNGYYDNVETSNYREDDKLSYYVISVQNKRRQFTRCSPKGVPRPGAPRRKHDQNRAPARGPLYSKNKYNLMVKTKSSVGFFSK